MVDFDHLGYDLNHCGGFLDGIQNFVQTCLHHTVHYKKRGAPDQFLPTMHMDKLRKFLIQSEVKGSY